MPSSSAQDPDTMVAARVPGDLARAFSAIAEREERSVSAELRRLMRQHVSLNASTPLGGGADGNSGGQARMDQASRSLGAGRDTRGFPDGSPKNKKRSPSDLRRKARRLTQRLSEARAERRESWPDGQSKFAAERQERKLGKLHADKRQLRRDVYARQPKLEGADFHRNHPGRS